MGEYNFQFDWKIHLSSNKTSLHQNPTPGSVLLHLHVWDDRHPWTSCQCCSAGRLCQQEGAISSHYSILYNKKTVPRAEKEWVAGGQRKKYLNCKGIVVEDSKGAQQMAMHWKKEKDFDWLYQMNLNKHQTHVARSEIVFKQFLFDRTNNFRLFLSRLGTVPISPDLLQIHIFFSISILIVH